MMNAFEKIKERLKQRLLANDECRKTALSKHNFDSVKYFQSLMFEDETIISIIHEEIESYNNGWIPCGEKEPNVAGNYLITDWKGDIRVERYCGSSWFAGFGYVIAWQHLPQPYKERD